ncbi:MAG: hypothetical protein AUH42_00435, partial [Gemmatimonadetes bacterium 13_1_40CM_70_11]
MTLDPNDFPDTGRFQILRRLGSGGMGVVYEALDRVRGEAIALKTLRWPDASAIYRFKKEFRTLADIAHANLVALYELFGEGGQWYFTMELVRGVDFCEHVRPHGLDVARLRPAVAQIAEGLVAIHRAGKLHRDLKPSNVRVTPEGRVVILDFGISADAVRSSGPHRTVEDGVWGTVEYMAPEQVDGQAAAASDWYALGCTLYEALTGRLPYTGAPLKVLMDKRAEDPEPPSAVAPDVPSDLAALCMDLLIREPERRPDGAEVLRRLGVSRPARLSGSPAARRADLLVGRERQLATLEEAFAATRGGRAVTVLVHGPSGIGKSTLLRRFVDRVARDKGAVVLSGRCYVRETMPYKGFDGVVDSLTRFLRALPDGARDRLIADDLRTAVQLFPALGRVAEIENLGTPTDEPSDPVELRRRGFGALRELFRRIAATAPVVLHIDDLQWGDSDSIALLDFLLDPPDAPPLLLIASFASEDVESHPFLGPLLARAGTPHCREIRVDRLSDDETRRLARELLGRHLPADSPDLTEMVRESAGNPFLVEQLVQYVTVARTTEQVGRMGISLGDMLEARLAQLPSGARGFLEALAVAARPLDAGVARDVAGLGGDERPLVALLQAERWLRPTSSAERLELYHDRIRRSLAAGIEAARLPAVHLRLAHAIEARQGDDPETLYEHYVGAGQSERGRACAVRAGDKAAQALAFERAARFYRRALELAPAEASDAGWLLARLGDALANAGRGAEAATVYLAAAEQATALDALELRRRAAEQLLRSGHIDQGLAVVRAVLQATGLGLARSPRHALLRLLARRTFLRIRGIGFVARRAEDLDPRALSRIDVCWSVAIGLARVDNIRAADFQTLALLLALRAGEPYRIARGLAAEAGFVSTGGGPSRKRAARLVAAARAVAERTDRPEALAYAKFAAGVTSFYLGRFAAARVDTEAAERLMRERCVGMVWEINTAQTFASSSLFYLGELAEVARRVPARLREARERGDIYAAADVLAGRPVVAWLLEDDVPGARQAVSEGMGPWSHQGFHLQHYFSLWAQGQIDLYAADGLAAWHRTTVS